MKWFSLIAATVLLTGCGSQHANVEKIADLQARSSIGTTAEWPLDPSQSQLQIKEMRDRAYAYCLSEKVNDQNCFGDQDVSLFAYANAFRVIRSYRQHSKSTFPFAAGHKQNPTAFGRVQRYCQSVYDDQGSRDARSLGPCMSAGVGADFFGIVPVP